MSKPIFIKNIICIVCIVGIVAGIHSNSSQAADHVPSIEITGLPNFTGCDNIDNPQTMSVPVYWNVTDSSLDTRSMLVDGVGEIVNYTTKLNAQYEGAGNYTLSLSPPLFDVPNGTHITISIITHYGPDIADGRSYESTLVYACGTGTVVSFTNTVISSDDPVTTGKIGPGPDMVPIPAEAVGGTFVANTPLYFAPDESSASMYMMKAGQSLWVLGINAEGTFYQVLLSGQKYWIPADSIGPTYDAVWRGAPLPITVIN